MLITDKGHSGPDIWLKTLNKGTNTKDMILKTWFKKGVKRKKINL